MHWTDHQEKEAQGKQERHVTCADHNGQDTEQAEQVLFFVEEIDQANTVDNGIDSRGIKCNPQNSITRRSMAEI